MACTDTHTLVETEIGKVATQYREATRFLAMARAYLGQLAEAHLSFCEILDHFDIDTAVGDQLTIIGKALGWPRCHCAGQRRPVFGFDCSTPSCDAPAVPVAGFCEAEWDCGGPDFIEFCFTDDELYRRFLKARVIALTGDYRRSGVTAASRALFGEHAAILRETPAVLVIATGRLLSQVEIAIAHLFGQVMPVAPGVRLKIWQSQGPAFGFGAGWGGFCAGAFPSPIALN
ncbi:DUF2612 domain-containing protein [Alsobacter sp. KACC 23698]|uniref:DUF2612 domain-containing protein n=1 Tax=Alsobacter sp. KACC 23698 TaxID=3149229 RepID=A0AAU7JMI7_9HYPH